MALIEALIASAVLGIGLVGATQLTLKTLHTASESRQHTVAQHLAQEAMDCLHARNAPCPAQDTIEVQGLRYERRTRHTQRGDGLAGGLDTAQTPGRVDDLHVTVTWAASGTRTNTDTNTNTNAAPSGPNRIEWHSSVSALPGWVGVSSP
jgi:Tfp pilus assembly protein PilV